MPIHLWQWVNNEVHCSKGILYRENRRIRYSYLNVDVGSTGHGVSSPLVYIFTSNVKCAQYCTVNTVLYSKLVVEN
jgi:hypothetical protein